MFENGRRRHAHKCDRLVARHAYMFAGQLEPFYNKKTCSLRWKKALYWPSSGVHRTAPKTKALLRTLDWRSCSAAANRSNGHAAELYEGPTSTRYGTAHGAPNTGRTETKPIENRRLLQPLTTVPLTQHALLAQVVVLELLKAVARERTRCDLLEIKMYSSIHTASSYIVHHKNDVRLQLPLQWSDLGVG